MTKILASVLRAVCVASVVSAVAIVSDPTGVGATVTEIPRQTTTSIGDVPAMSFDPVPVDEPPIPPPGEQESWTADVKAAPTNIFPSPQLPTKQCTFGKDNWGNCVAADRKVITIRESKDDRDDISAEFEKGLKDANNGGLLRLAKGKTYVIGKTLNLTWVNDIYLEIEGTLKFTNDIKYWQANNVYHPFQKSISFWQWGGKDLKIYGGGTLDGNGQAWWDSFKGRGDILDPSNTFYRPILIYTDNFTNFEVRDIKLIDSPCWFTFFVNSKNIVFDRTKFHAVSNSSALPKNTDGFDTYNVDGLTVTNTDINVGDDCVSPKPNTTNIHIENVWCNGTHGVSMGSIGQYPGTLDYISNAYIKNVTLANGENGARLKAWAGQNVGYGYIRNITYDGIKVENTDAPLVLDQCYFNIKPEICSQYPSRVNISDIRFLNFEGTASGRRGDVVVELKCSPHAECKNIELKNINIKNPKSKFPDRKGLVVCDGIKGSVGLDCVSSADAKKLKNQKNL